MSTMQPEQTQSADESRYHRLREAVADYHYFVQLEDGRVAKKNHGPKCEFITGYRPADYAVNPQLWIEIVLQEDRAVVERQTGQVLAGLDPGAIEYRICRKDGELRWIRKLVIPYYDAEGQLIAYDGLLRDITERKQAEETRRQSEDRYRLLFEDDLTGDYVATPDGVILLCNRAFVEIFGFSSREQTVGGNLASLYQDPASWPTLIARLRELKSVERYEKITRRNDATVLHIIENVVGTFDEQGNLVRLKGYVFDDTRSQLEAAKLRQHNIELEQAVLHRTRAVREKNSHFEAVLNSAFDAIITIDSQGMIHTINRAAEKMFGYSAADMIGQNVRMLMPSPYREEHDGYLQRYQKTGQKRILNAARELIAQRKDGSTIPIELSVTEVDHLNMFTGIIHDISERKRLQSHILQIADEEQRRIGQELHDGAGQN